MRDCSFQTLQLEGFHFLGNREGDYLITLDSLKTSSVQLSACRFSGLHSDGIDVKDTDDVEVRDCLFEYGIIEQKARWYREGMEAERNGEEVCWDEDTALLVNHGFIEEV